MKHSMISFISKTMHFQHTGRLHSRSDTSRQKFINPDGQEFVIFRRTVLDPAPGQPKKPAALFRVCFRVPKISPFRDRLIIALKSPVFVALPGFRSKLWMVDEKNDCYQGVYEWDTLQDAQNYVHSYSMEFMGQVAVPGGLSYEIIPGGTIIQEGAVLKIAKG